MLKCLLIEIVPLKAISIIKMFNQFNEKIIHVIRYLINYLNTMIKVD